MKFKCTSITKREGWVGNKFEYTAEFCAMSESDDEYMYGSICITTIKNHNFKVGETYDLELKSAS